MHKKGQISDIMLSCTTIYFSWTIIKIYYIVISDKTGFLHNCVVSVIFFSLNDELNIKVYNIFIISAFLMGPLSQINI